MGNRIVEPFRLTKGLLLSHEIEGNSGPEESLAASLTLKKTLKDNLQAVVIWYSVGLFCVKVPSRLTKNFWDNDTVSLATISIVIELQRITSNNSSRSGSRRFK